MSECERKRKAQFKPKEALKRTKEMALRKSLSWICFLREKSEFANLPLSLSLSICWSLSLPTHQHAHTCSFGQGDTTHRHTHKAEFALSIFTHTIVFCYYVYAAYLFHSLTHSLSVSLSLSLSSSLSADILRTAKSMQINLNKLN